MLISFKHSMPVSTGQRGIMLLVPLDIMQLAELSLHTRVLAQRLQQPEKLYVPYKLLVSLAVPVS